MIFKGLFSSNLRWCFLLTLRPNRLICQASHYKSCKSYQSHPLNIEKSFPSSPSPLTGPLCRLPSSLLWPVMGASSAERAEALKWTLKSKIKNRIREVCGKAAGGWHRGGAHACLLHLNLKPASGDPACSWKAAREFTAKGEPHPAPDTGCPGCCGKTKTLQLPQRGWQSRWGERSPSVQNKLASGGVCSGKSRWRAEPLSEQFRQACCRWKGWKA